MIKKQKTMDNEQLPEGDVLSLPKGDVLSLPKGWEMKKLGEICEKIFAGGDKPKEFAKFKTEEFSVPIYANGEKNKGLYGYTNTARINKPSITISGRGTIGYSEIRKEPFVPIVRLITLLPNEEIVDLNFLHYGIKNINFTNSGSSIPQLTVPMVKGHSIPIPPLPEQKRIVAILDRAFKAIDQAKAIAEQNLKNAKELFQSKLQAIFDNGQLKVDNGEWVERKFSDIVDYSKKTRGLILDNPIPFIPMDYVPLDKKYIKNNEYREKVSSGTFIKKGDLLLAKITPSFENGKQGIVDIQEEYGYATTEVIPFQGKYEVVETEYLFYFLKSGIRKYLEKKMEGATGRQRLPQKILNEILVPFPKSLKEQKQIVRQLDMLQAETKKLEAIYQQKIVNLEEMKKSVLQKAFSGQLTMDNGQ